VFGGLALTSYSQNVGAITITGVGSRFVVAVSGAILVGMALVPKAGAVIAMLPPPVLGGALIFMFGMIATVGVEILSTSLKTRRDALIFAASVGTGLAVAFAAPGTFDVIPPSVRILASDGIIVGLIVAIVLNLALPERD
jgi:xanthine/uracil permease